MNELGYEAATRQYLQPALQELVAQNHIPDVAAHQIANTSNNWMWNFTQQLPAGRTIEEREFVELLKNFVYSYAKQSGLLQPTGGMSRGVNYGGQMNGTFRSNTPNNTGYGGAGYGGGAKAPASTTIYGSKGDEPAGAAVPVEVAPKAVPQQTLIPNYVPDWVRNPDLTTTKTLTLGPIEGNEFTYPATDHERRLTYYKMVPVSKGHVSDIQTIAGRLKRYFDSGSDTVVRFDTAVCVALRGVSQNALSAALDDIHRIVETMGDTPSDKLEAIMQQLESRHPHGIFTVFSNLIVAEFIKVLKARMLFTDGLASIGISITSFNHIRELHPAANDPRFEIFAVGAKYARAYTSAMSAIVDLLGDTTVGTDFSCAAIAGRGLPGDEGAMWDNTLEHGLLHKRDEDFEVFYSKYAVLRYPVSLMFADMDFAKLPHTSKLMSGEAKAVVFDSKSGNFEHLIPRICTETRALVIHDIKTGDPIFVLGPNIDDHIVMARA